MGNAKEEEVDFDLLTRNVLFKQNTEATIPGAGTSAAEFPEKHTRVKVTMNIDGDIIKYFKDISPKEGRPYQVLINQILREYVDGTRPEQMSRIVQRLILSDEEFMERLAQKLKLILPETDV